MSGVPLHLEQAEKEVKSMKAQREIRVERTAIKELAREVKKKDRVDDAIRKVLRTPNKRNCVLTQQTMRQIIAALYDGRKNYYLGQKLKKLL